MKRARRKVTDDKRLRAARACNNCRRRKLKCNGNVPCEACFKARLPCSYADMKPAVEDTGMKRPPKPQNRKCKKVLSFELETSSWPQQPLALPTTRPTTVTRPFLDARDVLADPSPRDQDDDVFLPPAMQMLQDQTGRLLYIGDSSTFAYLHVFRQIVEKAGYYSPFTMDLQKERMLQHTVPLPSYTSLPSALPDRQTAGLLVESFFTNTSGMLEVFDRQGFVVNLDAFYADLSTADNRFVCLLYLTLAIGLVMSTPEPDTTEATVVHCLQAELFFRSAKHLGDLLNGFEDADFWSVQALVLMSVYMLAVSRHNTAYSYHGMAVRSAMALGLHREEIRVVLDDPQPRVRYNLWKTLYVLDRFISASLGRPMAIHEDNCTDSSITEPATENMLAVNATVRSCRIMGAILKTMYAERRLSTEATQDFAGQCGLWAKILDPCLRWQLAIPQNGSAAERHQATRAPVSRSFCLSILHVHLVSCHTVILLTRPFFFSQVQANRRDTSRTTPYLPSRTEKLSEVCVSASYCTIAMLQAAREAGYLPQRNPFVTYFLFTATLLVMSNEFAFLFRNASYEKRASQALSIMEFFALVDPQADRLLWILRALEDVVLKRSSDAATSLGEPAHPFQYDCFSASFADGSIDPIENLSTTRAVPSHWKHGVPDRVGVDYEDSSSPAPPCMAHLGGPTTGSIGGSMVPMHPPGPGVRFEAPPLYADDTVFLRKHSVSSVASAFMPTPTTMPSALGTPLLAQTATTSPDAGHADYKDISQVSISGTQHAYPSSRFPTFSCPLQHRIPDQSQQSPADEAGYFGPDQGGRNYGSLSNSFLAAAVAAHASETATSIPTGATAEQQAEATASALPRYSMAVPTGTGRADATIHLGTPLPTTPLCGLPDFG